MGAEGWAQDYYGGWVGSNLLVRPVVTLKPNVVVTGGNGTQSNPWTIAVQ